MKKVKILSVSKEGTFISVMKELTDDNNVVTINQHFIPEDAMEWRAAEYGTTDQDTLVDVLLYEPFLDLGIPGLYDYPTKQQASAAKLAATSAAKLKLKGSVDTQQYADIKANSLFDLEVIAIKSAHVDEVFNKKNQALAQLNARSAQVQTIDRATKLRQTLLTPDTPKN